ncbi:MAG: aldo/keto reductase [Bacteroidaceae bacterium]|nr:aldo/keto reductase [Bacteroidaceae bacterium]
MMYSADANRYKDMQYRRCGNSGVLLPAISLGFWHNFGNVTPEEQSRAIVRAAFDAGITHFDLANNYGPEPGAAEQRLGKFLHDDFASYRDELFIATKAAYDMWDGPYGSWASRKHLMASLDQSLRRLRLDYVDLFYCHRYDPSTPLEETLQALVDIVRAGKALYVGLSRWPLEAMLKGYDYLKQHDVPCLIYQGRFNLFDQTPKAEGILDAIAQNQTGFISFSPLAQGLLTNRYLNGIPSDSRMAHDPRYLHADMLTPQVLNKIKQLNELAVMRGETLSTMALSWILHHPGITSVLVGASSPAQLRQNLSALQSPKFSDEEQQTISNILNTNISAATV